MAVWDLNSNLDVFSMQTFLRGLIYVNRYTHLALVERQYFGFNTLESVIVE
jgi:hypothetical protein